MTVRALKLPTGMAYGKMMVRIQSCFRPPAMSIYGDFEMHQPEIINVFGNGIV